MRMRGGVVGGVERVHPRSHRRELALDLGHAAPVDHRHLGRDHEAAGGQLLLKPRHASPPASACPGR
jgi:cell shape-determining protein MreC